VNFDCNLVAMVGLATKAGLHDPRCFDQDGKGNLYVSSGHSIHRIDAETGIISTVAGSGERGFAGDHGFVAEQQPRATDGRYADGRYRLGFGLGQLADEPNAVDRSARSSLAGSIFGKTTDS
jgi:hypothetical protein